MGPYSEVDYTVTSPYVDSRVDFNTCTLGKHMLESTLSHSGTKNFASVISAERNMYSIVKITGDLKGILSFSLYLFIEISLKKLKS
jgi:hypothetical protein